MSEWDNPIEQRWVTPKKDMFKKLCNEIYTMGYKDGMSDAREVIDDE